MCGLICDYDFSNELNIIRNIKYFEEKLIFGESLCILIFVTKDN